jgi:uncharacterized protein
VKGIILTIAMLFPSVAAYFYFVRLSGAGQGEISSAVQIVYGSTKLLMFVLPFVYILTCDRRWQPFPRRDSIGFGWGIGFGVVVGLAIILLAGYLSDTALREVPARVRAKINEFGVSSPLTYLLMSAFISTIHAFLEEWYWRWFVFGRLRMLNVSFLSAAFLSALAFTGHHVFVLNVYLAGQFWNATVPFSLAIAIGGVFWAWLYERTGSLVGPWISHLLVDVAIMVVGYRMYFVNG